MFRGQRMKDQNSVPDNEPQEIKFNRGLDLFTESVLKPDPELRNCAHNQKCYHELMYIRSYVLDYLKTLRND
jgi:hypothetical protein